MTHLELSNSASRLVWHIIRRNGQTLRDSERYFPRRREYYQDESRVYTEPRHWHHNIQDIPRIVLMLMLGEYLIVRFICSHIFYQRKRSVRKTSMLIFNGNSVMRSPEQEKSGFKTNWWMFCILRCRCVDSKLSGSILTKFTLNLEFRSQYI